MRGAKSLSAVALLAVAACGADQGELHIRSIPTALAQGQKPVSFRVAEARAQFALGNVALALEGFRKALREEPDSVDAALGMAGCYVRMARYDLSQRYFETALASDPRNPEALTALALSLDLQGKTEAAAGVRSELAMISVPAAEPVAPGEPVKALEPDIVPPLQTIEPAAVAAVAAAPAVQQAPAASVTIDLPQTTPVRVIAETHSPAQSQRDAARPRLERTSLGEIALITSGAPIWKAQAVNRTRISTTIRFVPIRQPASEQAAVRLLNAARVNRLAARTRTFLTTKGWERIAIGDAPAVRARSMILYPARHRALAERLAAEFGFALAPNPRVKLVTVYLGRDANRRTARSAG
jgi:tetratricopeptide (TPR) repeat protein